VAKQPATPAPISDTRRERLLAFMTMGMVGLSVVAFFAIVIGTAMGAGANNGFSQGIWPTIFLLPVIALPIGILLLIVLMIVSMRRRSREAQAPVRPGNKPRSK
jgi:ABC-type dipeptide/oligopeptide/nickel transport system permease component